MQVIKNYQQSGDQKVSDMVLGDYEKLKVSGIAVIQLMKSSVGVKVLSEKTGNDDNFQNGEKWFGYS